MCVRLGGRDLHGGGGVGGGGIGGGVGGDLHGDANLCSDFSQHNKTIALTTLGHLHTWRMSRQGLPATRESRRGSGQGRSLTIFYLFFKDLQIGAVTAREGSEVKSDL